MERCFIYVCVCACNIERKREGGERQMERWVYGEMFYIYMCVCVHVI